jgi:SWI/SNF-related matrix-associated actin-dependent regulator 1 of chromatin subfamily A
MRVIALDEPGRFGIQEQRFSPALVSAGRAIPGMTWDATQRLWTGYSDAVAVTCDWLKGKGLRLETGALGGRVVPLLTPHTFAGLRHYQADGVRFLLERAEEGVLLADDMGLGKSCQALTAAKTLGRKTLVVCPSYVRGVWWNSQTGGEIEKWWPESQGLEGECVYLPSGLKPGKKTIESLTAARVVVIHYDILAAWAGVLAQWLGLSGTVIFDEIHALQNESSKRSKSAKLVRAAAKYAIGLSGTPMTNRPRDLWNVLDTLSPGRFGKNFFGFGLRYCNGHKEEIPAIGKTVWKFDGSSNTEELRARLGYLMLRRLKQDVALELPAKTRQVIWQDLKGASRPSGIALARNARELRAMLDRSADQKLEAGLELVLGHLESQGAKVVVFCYRRAVAEWVANAARKSGFDGPVGVIHGGVSTLRRGKATEELKTSPGAGLLAVTIDSCSVGIDLSFAAVGVVLELTYEPHELLQLESRLHRFGARDPVLIQYLCLRGSIDELIAAKVISKLDTFEAVVGQTGDNLGSGLGGQGGDTEAEVSSSILKELFSEVG